MISPVWPHLIWLRLVSDYLCWTQFQWLNYCSYVDVSCCALGLSLLLECSRVYFLVLLFPQSLVLPLASLYICDCASCHKLSGLGLFHSFTLYNLKPIGRWKLNNFPWFLDCGRIIWGCVATVWWDALDGFGDIWWVLGCEWELDLLGFFEVGVSKYPSICLSSCSWPVERLLLTRVLAIERSWTVDWIVWGVFGAGGLV